LPKVSIQTLATVGTIIAATLICEVGDPCRFARESKFARWSGTGAVAVSSGEGGGQPVRHRLDIGGNRRVNSVLYSSASHNNATIPTRAAISRERPPRARPDEKPDARTNASSLTASSAAAGRDEHTRRAPLAPAA